MKFKVDQQADALYLTLGEAPASNSEEVSPGIIADYDEHGRVVGLEMLHLSKRALVCCAGTGRPEIDIRRLLFESVPQAG